MQRRNKKESGGIYAFIKTEARFRLCPRWLPNDMRLTNPQIVAVHAAVVGLILCASSSVRSESPRPSLVEQPQSNTVDLREAEVYLAQAPTQVGDQPDAPNDDEQDDGLGDLLDLSLDEMTRQAVVVPAFDQVVTTVARRESTIGRSPAAVFVVTNEMIRRSGATSIAEALRLVPGLNVARIDANKWAISSRGFNDRFANKMLVQVDGRTVYTPVFSGTYWDVQDVVLEDVDRIEVIRGPGATVWGANAVNGVINVLTKTSANTQGVYAKAGGGTEERGFSTARVGGTRDDLTWRAYGKWFDRGPQFTVGGAPERDDWQVGRGGFRMDWSPSQCDRFTFQGDMYDGNSGVNSIFNGLFNEKIDGNNILTTFVFVLHYSDFRKTSP